MENKNTSKTILTICIGLLVIYILSRKKIFLNSAVIIGIVGVFSNYLSEKIEWLWLKVGEILGYINSKIILSIVFYLFLVPVAFIYKLTKKNVLNLKRTNQNSFYTIRDHSYTKSDIENPW